jgi:predicted dehydrogenase
MSSHADRIRIGIVGLGFGQQVHAPAFAGIDGCEVVAIAGRDPQRAAAAAHKLEIARSFGCWETMLNDSQLDAVSIAVPPHAQPAIVAAAAKRKIAVFCEKPAAADVTSAAAMLAAVREHRVEHAVNFLFPEIPAWREAKRRIDELAARGGLRHAALAWRVETYASRHNSNSWKRRAGEGGGALSNFVSHSIFYLEWLFGRIKQVQARLFPRESMDDSRVDAWIEFESGLPLTMSVATDCPFGSGHRLEVYGGDGAVVLANAGSDYVQGFDLQAPTRSAGDDLPSRVEDMNGSIDGRVWATARLARRFVDRLRADGPTTPNLVDGLRVQQVIEGFRRSHQLNEPIRMVNQPVNAAA